VIIADLCDRDEYNITALGATGSVKKIWVMEKLNVMEWWRELCH